MPITIRCSDCGKALKVKDESAGKKVKCPACGSVIAVPRAEPPEEAAKTPRKPPRPTPPVRDEDDEDIASPPARRAAPLRGAAPPPRDEDEGDSSPPPPPRGRRAAPVREDEEEDAPSRPRRARKESAGMKVLQGVLGLLILCSIGFAVWWFFLRGGGGSSGEWKEFVSKEGNFKVLMPGEPKMEVKTTGPVTQKLYKVEFPKRREAYVASYADYPPERVSDGADQIINAELQSLFNMPKRLRSKGKRDADELKGKPGVRYGEVTLVTQDEGTLRVRALMARQRLFVLVMNSPSDDSYEETAKKFFGSFDIVGEIPEPTIEKKDDGTDKDSDKDKGGEGKDKGGKDKDTGKDKETKDRDTKKKEDPKEGGTDFKGHTGHITAMALSAGMDRLATVSEHDATLRVWEYPGGKQLLIAEIRDEYRTPNSVAFSPDRQVVAVGLGGPGEKLVLYDLALKSIIKKTSVDRSATFLGFSTDGKHLIHINAERAYRFDPKEPGKGDELGQARRGALSPDGKLLYVSRGDDFRVIELATKKPLKTPEMKFSNVNALAISGDGKLVAIADADSIQFWNGDAQAPLPGKEVKVGLRVESMALSTDGSFLVVRGNRRWQAYALPEGKLLDSGKADAASERILLTHDHGIIVNVGPSIQVIPMKK